MKNLKLIKEYYRSLNTTGRAVFMLGGVVVIYILLEVIS
jgi:hypothetical protein